ncbi:geranylgeranyl transferase type-2 subunit alpha isoform X2 [Petromyzon marinus]
MHGRVKVRSTEEQLEVKRRERSKKLERFSAAMERLLTKRAAGEYDSEALDLTASVLTQNPDLHTLWNFRREILQQMQQQSTTEQLQAAVEAELELSAACLRGSPKSYCAWHQRAWALPLAPRPPWARELQLTGTFLQCDERNFHCWDHRRFVVARGRAELAHRGNTAEVVTPGNTAEVVTPGNTAEVVTPGNTAEVVTPGNTAEVVTPGNTAEVVTPGNTAEVVTPGNTAEVVTPGNTAKVVTSDNTAKVVTPGNTAEVVTPDNTAKVVPPGDATDAGDGDGDGDDAAAGGATRLAFTHGAELAFTHGAELAFTHGAELAFTHGLLSSNFSNFSSWHYRAQQLALAGPRPARPPADALPAEFELVKNAIFTDPDDQSAWLYHRWLLGRAEQAESVSCLYVSQSLQLALVVFTRPINVLKDEQEEVVV